MHRHTLRILFLSILIVSNIFIWYRISRAHTGVLTVAFLDVGQGDAIFVETPHGVQMLIDGGPGNTLLRRVSRIMPFYDRSVDLLLVSNPDKDHIEGFIGLLNTYTVSAVVEPGTAQDTGTYTTLKDIIKEKNIPIINAQRGMRLVLDNETEFAILFPDRDASRLSPNTGSIVGQLIYGDTKFLFPGDAPDEIEEYVGVLSRNILKSDVLKVGHHGSHTSTSRRFLELVRPVYAVISSGKENKYGHPHSEVLNNLADSGAIILRTDQEGTVVFQSNGSRVWRK